jgi:hypothetical protein
MTAFEESCTVPRIVACEVCPYRGPANIIRHSRMSGKLLIALAPNPLLSLWLIDELKWLGLF